MPGGQAFERGWRAGGREAALVAVLFLAVLIAAVLGSSTRSAHGQQASGSQTFGYSGGGIVQFTVPDGVFYVTAVSRGGRGGGGTSDQGAGGRPGIAEATIPVSPGDVLGVQVGRYGGSKGGDGCGNGGDHGATWGPSSGHSGDGGGGGTCVSTPFYVGNQIVGWTPRVWAGGGGGGGGNDSDGALGGAGGDGGVHPEQGSPGLDETHKPNDEGRVGGCGGCEDSPNGHGGEGSDFGEAVGGGGGGGGGGYKGGGGGNNGVYRFEQVERIGGSGGGGGLSYIHPNTLDPQHSVSSLACASTQDDPRCNGSVTLSWGAPPATAVASAGNHSHATITQDFPTLAVTVRDADGIPVDGIQVEWVLPASGPSGSFPGGEGSAITPTNSQGVATAPRLQANEIAGRWALEAGVEDIATPVRFNLTNDAAATTTAVTSTADPSHYGEDVGFTATVHSAPAFDSAPPTGLVEFSIDGVPIPTPVSVDPSTGQALLPASAVPLLDVGDHDVEAAYLGDAGHSPSTGALTQTVAKAPTAVALVSSPNPSDFGEEVIFEATVTSREAVAEVPTGSVDFEDEGGTVLATAPLDAQGRADWETTSLPLGTTKVVATYGGDAGFEAGTGSVVQAVGPAATATLVASSANPAAHGEPLTWTATVRRLDQGAAVDGTVAFELDGAEVCPPAELDASGSVTCQPPQPLPSGEHSVIAAYEPGAGSGDEPSFGTLEQSVIPARSLTEVAVVPEPSVLGEAISLRATISAAAGEPDLAGAVQFALDGEPAGAPVDVDDGEAELASSCALPLIACNLAVGAHLVEAEYVPASPDVGASRAVATHRVDQAPTVTSIESSADPVREGEPVRFTARVAAAAGLPKPFGPVQFLADGVPFSGSVGLAGGTATSPSLETLTPGSHEIVARFLGSGAYAPSEVEMTQEVERVVPPRLQAGSRRARVRPSGTFRLKVRCVGTSRQRCSAGLLVKTARRVRGAGRALRRGAKLAFREVSLPTRTVRKLPVDIDKRAARGLRSRRALRVTVRFVPHAGTMRSQPRKLRLLAPKRKGGVR